MRRLVEAFDLDRNIKMSRRLKIELSFGERSHRLRESVHQDAMAWLTHVMAWLTHG